MDKTLKITLDRGKCLSYDSIYKMFVKKHVSQIEINLGTKEWVWRVWHDLDRIITGNLASLV